MITIPHHDVWVLARLRAGHSLNGEVEAVTPCYKSLARRLAAAPVEGRGGVLDDELSCMPPAEATALIEAMARANPDGPAPDAAPDDGEPWGPLRLGELPPVPDFPLDILPLPVARLAAEAAGAIGCDIGMVAGPMLAIAGGLIGRSASLLLGSNWFAQACIFLANIASPGDGKSPALGHAEGPVAGIDRELADAFGVDKQLYLDAMAAFEQGKKARDGGTAAAKPVPPIPSRVNIDDATMEAVFRVLAANPRGLVMVRDELSSLILGLNQYKGGGGNDRPNLLKTWSARPVLIDRVLNEFGEPIRIPHPALGIVGNLPPAMLAEMVNRRGDDGLVDRFLFVYPDRRPKLKSHQRRPVSNEAVEGWDTVARNLWGRPTDTSEGRSCPHVIYFNNPGKAEFNRLHDLHVDEVNAPHFPDSLRGPWSKLEEYAGRLCLILTLLRHASDPTADPQALPLAGPDDARDAWRLVDYFKAHHRRVRAYLEGKGLGGAPEGARFVLRWIRNHPDVDTFPESELTRVVPQLRADRAMMEDGLLWLEQRKVVRRVREPERPKGTRGRKPAPHWEIHPELRDMDNKENTDNSLSDPAPETSEVNFPYSPNSPYPSSEGDVQEGGDDAMRAF